MAATLNLRTVLAIIGAGVCVVVAAVAAVQFLGGAPKRFEQRAVPAAEREAIERLTRELVGLGASERAARLRELMSGEAPPRALDAVAAQLEALRRARGWTLAAADGYGPTLIKALYDVTDRRGRTTRAALIFERREGGIAPLDIAR